MVEPTEISPGRDEWAEWLADRRFGGDPETRRRFQRELDVRRDKVLDLARLREGETVLDVGCGEGLIAFGALERGAGSVIFSDISVDLLNLCREAATALGVVDRCRFVQASADKLDPISDTAVDVVTTRSVLIYVSDKPAAFREFARVLRPGAASPSSSQSTASLCAPPTRGPATISPPSAISARDCVRCTTRFNPATSTRCSTSTNAT